MVGVLLRLHYRPTCLTSHGIRAGDQGLDRVVSAVRTIGSARIKRLDGGVSEGQRGIPRTVAEAAVAVVNRNMIDHRRWSVGGDGDLETYRVGAATKAVDDRSGRDAHRHARYDPGRDRDDGYKREIAKCVGHSRGNPAKGSGVLRTFDLPPGLTGDGGMDGNRASDSQSAH